MGALGRPEADKLKTLDDIITALAQSMPAFEAVPGIAPAASFRADGMKIPRQPHRYSGRTSMHANVSVDEPNPTDDQDSALSFSMEGYGGQPPGAIIPRYWSPGWNSVQALNKFQSEVGGPLRGGDPGIRLIEPVPIGQPSYFREVPEPFQCRDGEWLIVPIYHIFGSEELSAVAPAIAEQAPKPYLLLNNEDAAELHLADEWVADVELANTSQRLTVKLDPSLPKGVAGLSVGLRGSEWVDLPSWGKVRAGK